MCVNNKWITNPYSHASIYVKCGKCEACKMEKANYRASRIRHAASDSSLISLFCTFTYRNTCVPYIRKSDFIELKKDFIPDVSEIPIYRDSTVRRVRVSSDYQMKYITKYEPVEIGKVVVSESLMDSFEHSKIPYLQNYFKDKVGVCFYKDIQDFFKRLKQNLARRYGYNGRLLSYQCSEYGETFNRPHFHVNILCEKDSLEDVKSAINEAWPFDSKYTRVRKVEIARNASSYLATYVNSSSNVPLFFKDKSIRAKHSYSRTFGVDAPYFSLNAILEKVKRRDVTYSVATTRNGVPAVVNLPIPEYVINRHFPYFKGFGALSDDEIRQLLSNPDKVYLLRQPLDYSIDDCHRFLVRLRNSFYRYHEVCNKTEIDYAIDYVNVRNCISSLRYINFVSNPESIPIFEQYDNLADVRSGKLRAPTIVNNIDSQLFENLDLNPNNFTYRKLKTQVLSDLFRKKMKTKQVNDYIISHSDNFV